ncbi:MAG: cysteine desulfurase family protein [Candidatus Micrarchaeota archaeon]
MIYLDNAATTRTDERVLEEMTPYFLEKYGNPSSAHAFGKDARKAMEDARAMVAKTINANSGEIVFTSGGTESDNLAILGAVNGNGFKSIATTVIEHPAVKNVFKYLESKGVTARYFPVSREGVLEVEVVKAALDEGVQFVSVMHANNEVGSIQPIKEIGALCRKKKAVFHVDAVQSLGKLKIDVRDLNVDLMSFSSHKIHGPKGVGALYVREGLRIDPIVKGGGHERGRRSGTENVPGIVGFAKAVELSHKEFDSNVNKMTKLRNKLIDGALEIKDSWLNGSREKRLCNNANIGFKHAEGEALVFELSGKGIAVSTGSACSSHSLEDSPTLMALGLSHSEAHSSLRFTLSHFNTDKEIDTVLQELPKAVSRFRGISL